MCVDVVGQAAPTELIPQSIGLMRIMVAWQQMPLHRRVSPHPLDSLIARAQGRIWVVVHVARNQYVAHMMFAGEFADARDRLQPCQLEPSHRRAIDVAKDFAYLPVASMDEAKCHNKESIAIMPIWEQWSGESRGTAFPVFSPSVACHPCLLQREDQHPEPCTREVRGPRMARPHRAGRQRSAFQGPPSRSPFQVRGHARPLRHPVGAQTECQRAAVAAGQALVASHSRGRPTGSCSCSKLSDWLAENRDGFGRRYVSELRRYFRG